MALLYVKVIFIMALISGKRIAVSKSEGKAMADGYFSSRSQLTTIVIGKAARVRRY